MNNKKALGPVIATSLLIVVAVITLVLFNSWFQTYSSNLMADVETQSSINAIPEIETVIGDFVYIKTPSNLTIDRILVDGNECDTNISLGSGMQGVNISSCLSGLSTSTPKITLITDNNIVTESVYLKDVDVGRITYNIDLSCLFKSYRNESGCLENLLDNGCGFGTILDVSTNLCWQKNLSSYLDFNGSKIVFSDAITYCDNLVLSGHNDWYLPSRREISSILDLSVSNPSIIGSNTIFQDIGTDYWTATNGINPWHIDFSDSNENWYFDTQRRGVVCSRINGVIPKYYMISRNTINGSHFGDITYNGFERNNDDFVPDGCGVGTVLDDLTGLCWQQNMSSYLDFNGGHLNWSEANNYCDTLSLGGNNDWKNPERLEIFTILSENEFDDGCFRFENNGFTSCDLDYGFWSSTETYGDNNFAHAFLTGLPVYLQISDPSFSKLSTLPVLCVR